MNELEGFDALIRNLDRLGQGVDEESLKKATKKGAAMVMNQIKNYAPSLTDTLRSGLILHKEKSRVKGKVVYDVYPDPKKNAIFQKPILNPVRSKTPYAYYPASQEYGFFTRRPDGGMTYVNAAGEEKHLDKVPGQHYMRTGAEVIGEAAKTVIGQGIIDEIAKELGK